VSDIVSEYKFLPNPRAFDAPVREGFYQNIAITFVTEKLDWCGYPKVKKIEDMFIRFDRMYERDIHTYRLMDRHCMTAKAALAKMVIKQQKLMLETSMEV